MKNLLIPILALIVLHLPLNSYAQSAWVEHVIDDLINRVETLQAVDIDNDGDLDLLLAANDTDEGLIWWENDGDGHFTERTVYSYCEPTSAFAADIDGDGDMDIVETHCWYGQLYWWENNGLQNFDAHFVANVSNYAYSACAADVDGDGNTDLLAIVGYSNDEYTWWQNDGNETFTQHEIGMAGWGCTILPVDMEPDGDIDVLGSTSSPDNDILWWKNDGSENFAEHIIDGYFYGAYSAHAADIDSDGDMDVVGGANFEDDIAWWENDGFEDFTKHEIACNFSGVKPVYAVDIDSDEDVDIVAGAEDDEEIAWWENDGNQNFEQHLIAEQFASCVLQTGDFDDDGDMDVVSAEYSGKFAWYEQVTPADVTIELDYVSGSPVPAEGGNVYFDLIVESADPSTLDFDAWLYLVDEAGRHYTFAQRHFESVTAGIVVSRPGVFFTVPGSYPAGNYRIVGNTGIYLQSSWSADGFEFEKLGDADDAGFPLLQVESQSDLFAETAAAGPVEAPAGADLVTASPNPFNPTTTISYQLPDAGHVNLTVYDLQGREVAELVRGWREAGPHDVTFDASHLTSGIYICRLTTGSVTSAGKMVLTK